MVHTFLVVVVHKPNKYHVDLKILSFIKIYTYESLAPFQLKHEFTMVVAGPSKSSKTEFVKHLVQNIHWISLPPEKK
jgi:hypothetical protein